MKRFRLVAGTAASLLTVSAFAELTYFEAARWKTYTQTSDAQPTVLNSFGFTGRVFTKTANEVQNGTVETPKGTTHNTLPNGALITAYSHFGFPTEAALDAIYPTGTYKFTLTNGPRAGDNDTMTFDDPGWADVVPYLTGSTFSDLQNADVTAPITFNWGSFGSPGKYTALQTYFYLRDITTGTQVFGQQGKPDTFKSKTFAANSLVAGHEYQFQLMFGALEQAQTQGGLAPASWTGAKYISTSGRFKTAAPIGPIHIQLSGATATLTWNGNGVIERSVDLVTWSVIEGATSPYPITISPDYPALYFRQRIP